MPPRPRNTAQRQAIVKQLSELENFVSAQQLHEILARSDQRIGLATVYRTLQVLTDDGTVDILRTDSELLYRLCETEAHHHHLVCRSCGKTVEISGGHLEKWIKRMAAEAGFADIQHTIEFSGLCGACADASGNQADSPSSMRN